MFNKCVVGLFFCVNVLRAVFDYPFDFVIALLFSLVFHSFLFVLHVVIFPINHRSYVGKSMPAMECF